MGVYQETAAGGQQTFTLEEPVRIEAENSDAKFWKLRKL